MQILKTALILMAFTLNSCATIFHGSVDSIAISSQEPQSQIYINDVYMGDDSVKASIPKNGDILITVKKQGCQDANAEVNRVFDPTTFLGLFLDLGIYSILVIDGLATQAIRQADETNYLLSPKCATL